MTDSERGSGIEVVPISSRDYRLKVADLLQQNWALIDATSEGARVCLFEDTSGAFDELIFPSKADAEVALFGNGFRRYAEDGRAQGFIARPEPQFRRQPHPNGPIYSGGRFWK